MDSTKALPTFSETTFRPSRFSRIDLAVFLGFGLVVVVALLGWWNLAKGQDSPSEATDWEDVAARFVAISRSAEFSGEDLVVASDLDRTLERIAEAAFSSDHLLAGNSSTEDILGVHGRENLKQWLHLRENTRLEFIEDSGRISSWPMLPTRLLSPPIP